MPHCAFGEASASPIVRPSMSVLQVDLIQGRHILREFGGLPQSPLSSQSPENGAPTQLEGGVHRACSCICSVISKRKGPEKQRANGLERKRLTVKQVVGATCLPSPFPSGQSVGDRVGIASEHSTTIQRRSCRHSSVARSGRPSRVRLIS